MSNLSHAALRATSNGIADHTIGFVRIGDGGRALLGSGTLVAAGERRAVVTTRSVIERLPGTGRLGFVLRTELNQITLDTADLAYQSVGDELGIVMLASHAARRMVEFKRFFDLQAESPRSIEHDPGSPSSLWCINGFSTELTTTHLPLDCFDMVCGYTNVTGVGRTPPKQLSEEQDGLELLVSRDGEPGEPMIFEGLLGGGLWQIRLGPDGSAMSAPRVVYAGVVVSAPTTRASSASIRCAGQSVIASATRALA